MFKSDTASVSRISVLKALHAWASAGADEDDIPLDKCCEFVMDLQKVVRSEALESLKLDWFPGLKAACEKSEGWLSQSGKAWAAETWVKSGPEEVLEHLSTFKYLPPVMHQVLDLAKGAGTICNIPEVKLDSEDSDKTIAQLLKFVKKWLSLLSIDMDFAETFIGAEAIAKAKQFQKDVEAEVMKTLSTALAEQNKILPTVKKYRLELDGNSEFLLSCMVSFQVFCVLLIDLCFLGSAQFRPYPASFGHCVSQQANLGSS